MRLICARTIASSGCSLPLVRVAQHLACSAFLCQQRAKTLPSLYQGASVGRLLSKQTTDVFRRSSVPLRSPESHDGARRGTALARDRFFRATADTKAVNEDRRSPQPDVAEAWTGPLGARFIAKTNRTTPHAC